MRALAVFRVVHRWLGLLLAVIVFAVALSGGLLLFRKPYYRALYPALDRPITTTQVERRAEVLTTIETMWPRHSIRLVRFPQPGLNGFQVWLHDGTEAFVDPETGAVIGQWRSSEELSAVLFDLHAHLLGGEEGELVNGYIGLFTIFMALTGVVLWWPARRGAFQLRGALPRRLRPSELLRSHAALGTLAAVPIVVFVATGVGMVFYAPLSVMMTGLFDERPPEATEFHIAPRDASLSRWSAVLTSLDSTFSDGRMVYYSPGTPDNVRLMFRKRLPGEWHPNGRSYIAIDPYTAGVVHATDAREQGAGTRLMHKVYPLHAATVGGTPMIAAGAVAALALTWLALSGVWTYFGRRAATARNTRARRVRTMAAANEFAK